MSEQAKPKYYSIGHVARITDLPTHTLRYWESMFPQLNPRKSRAGRRMYTREDVRMVELIQELLHNQRYTIKGAQEALDNGVHVIQGEGNQEGSPVEVDDEFIRRVESVKGKIKALISELKQQ